MQTLDTLGAGFQLASHDLDIRGAGNLLGEEQSGHIREVGIELYQQLLEEAVEAARGRVQESARADWSPQLNLGIPVLIPEEYVADLSVRMGLYRRIGQLANQGEIDAFAAELVDPLRQDADRGRVPAQYRGAEAALPRGGGGEDRWPARRRSCCRSTTTSSSGLRD